MVRIDHQGVQVAFLRDGGVAAVRDLWESKQVSDHTVRRAYREMRKADPDDGGLDALADWMRDVGIMKERNRRVRPGDVKRYKAQEADGAPFLRLPIDVLAARKDTPTDEVEVHFFNGSIKVFDIGQE